MNHAPTVTATAPYGLTIAAISGTEYRTRLESYFCTRLVRQVLRPSGVYCEALQGRSYTGFTGEISWCQTEAKKRSNVPSFFGGVQRDSPSVNSGDRQVNWVMQFKQTVVTWLQCSCKLNNSFSQLLKQLN